MYKLYYEDSHLYHFSAKVIDIYSEADSNVIVLEKTAFFPLGGGQPGDEGRIGNAYIYDVREKDNVILHYTRAVPDFSVGETVEGHIDEALRFARMQAHSGEHIFSGVAHNLYGAENVGFHMVDLVMTVDFDLPLSKQQLNNIEQEANKWVYKNVPVTTEILSGDKLTALQYRSKLDLRNDVRIVTIEGCDKCSCCAPHVSRTGEIGLIKVISSMSHRGGIRITLLCGVKAFEDYFAKNKDILCISEMLKAPNDMTPSAVSELCERISAEKRKTQLQSKKLYSFIAETLKEASKQTLFFEDYSSDELREIAEHCKSKANAFVAVFSGNDEEGYSFVIASSIVKLRQYSKMICSALSGRGGGTDDMLQGKASAEKSVIIDFLNEFEVKLHENEKKEAP